MRGSTRTIDPRRPPRASEGGAAQADVDREPRGPALRQRRQPLQHPGQEGCRARFGLHPALGADDRDQDAVAIEEQRAGAGIPRLEGAGEPRPEAARREGHGAPGGERPGLGLVAPLEGEGRRVQVAERVSGLPGEVGERRGGVEASFLEGREDERLGREGLEIGEGDGFGARAPLPRRRDGSSRAGRDRGARPAPGARERGGGGRGVAGQEALSPQGEVGGSPQRDRGREGGGGREGHEAPRREPAEVGQRPRAAPAPQAFVRAPASRATCTPW